MIDSLDSLIVIAGVELFLWYMTELRKEETECWVERGREGMMRAQSPLPDGSRQRVKEFCVGP